MQDGRLNQIQLGRDPGEYPESYEGNLQLYYELEWLRTNYESEPLEDYLHRYILIMDTLGNRGLYIDYSTDLAIDKATHKADWREYTEKALPEPVEK